MTYYWRTWLRERLPSSLVPLVPKRYCCPPGEHQWYFNGGATHGCYHCRIMAISAFDHAELLEELAGCEVIGGPYERTLREVFTDESRRQYYAYVVGGAR